MPPGFDQRIVDARCTDADLVFALADGRVISAPLTWFPRLVSAQPTLRTGLRIDSGGESVTWDDLKLTVGIEAMLHYETPSIQFLRTSPLDEEFLLCLDQVTFARTFHADGFRFCGGAYNKGIGEAGVARAEEIVGVQFPDDLRFFLKNLHDPKRVFFPWADVTKALYAERIEKLVSGILFDVEENALWLDDWGARPSKKAARADAVRAELATWPKLVPIYGHRFMPIEPCADGNPVFSINQSDLVIYGPDLGRYLCNEFLALGPGSFIDGWRWASGAPRPEFAPWHKLGA